MNPVEAEAGNGQAVAAARTRAHARAYRHSGRVRAMRLLIPVVAAWHAAGGRLALVGHLEPADLDEALDATEPAKAGV